MSRIRVTNIGKHMTEDGLRKHFRSLGDVTDCKVVRHSGTGVPRMAFVGFKTSGAGQEAVAKLNGSFIGTQRISVEAALGLSDAPKTRRHAGLEDQSTAPKVMGSVEQKKAARSSGKDASPGEPPAKAAKKKASATAAGATKTTVGAERSPKAGAADRFAGGSGAEVDDETKQFAADLARMKAGPTWMGEVLLPAAASTPQEEDQDGKGKKKRRRGDAKEAVPVNAAANTATALNDEDAQERQQALGAVDDLDFLNSKVTATPSFMTEQDPGLQPDTSRRGAPDLGGDDTAEETHELQFEGGVLKDQPEVVVGETVARESRRVFVKNIPYTATPDELKNYFSSHIGPVEAVHVPLTRDTKQSKGSAFIRFAGGNDAVAALQKCNGAIFEGRLIRVEPAPEDPYERKAAERANKDDPANAAPVDGDGNPVDDSFKAKAAEKRKKNKDKAITWNPLFMTADAALTNVADRLNVAKADILDPTAPDAAVRAAVAEAFLSSESKNVLGDAGIDFESLKSALHKNRSDRVILVKNITSKTSSDEMVQLFKKYGPVEKVAVPSNGLFLLVEFVHPQDARVAFQRLAFKKINGNPMYLEWAPIGSLRDPDAEKEMTLQEAVDKTEESATNAPTVYITNLPWKVAKDAFMQFLHDAAPKLLKNAKLIKNVNLISEKGRAYVQLEDEAAASYVINRLNGRDCSGRVVSAVYSTNKKKPTQDEEEEATKKKSQCPHGSNPLKVIVKNLPFEATEEDLRKLFASFSEIKAVRVPRRLHRFSNTGTQKHRGFGFVEFLTEQEAANAINALTNTHLYGRHLVLQYAQIDDEAGKDQL